MKIVVYTSNYRVFRSGGFEVERRGLVIGVVKSKEEGYELRSFFY